MSFPSAIRFREANPGSSAEEALLSAIRQDTKLGYEAISRIPHLLGRLATDALKELRSSMKAVGDAEDMPGLENEVLRLETRGQGLKVDFNPNSKMGQQIARLMGTDVARSILSQSLHVEFGFANCCGVIVSTNPADVKFTAEEQFQWQYSIDC